MISRYKDNSSGIYIDKNLSDLVKVFACITVAVHHYAQHAISVGYSSNVILKLFSSQGGYLGVALFFFLSGYGLMMSEAKHPLNCLSFFKHRLSKVLIPSILITVIWLPVYYLVIAKEDSINRNIWGDRVMWFVQTLILQYIFFYVYAYIRRSYAHYKTLVLFLLSVISFIISSSVSLLHAISLPLFYLGVWIAEHSEMTRKEFSRFVIPGIFFLVMLTACYIGRNNMMLLHALFNYMVITIILLILSVYKVSLSQLPPPHFPNFL